MLRYQTQHSELTLAEGLAEYHRANPGLKRGPSLSSGGKDFFRRHDVIHIVWGCDTSLPHEAIVKLSSFFGTTEGFGVMAGYLLYDSQDIYRALRVSEILWTLLLSFVLVPRAICRGVTQKKKWPWADYDALLDRPLRDLRAEYGIRVAHG